MIILSTIWILDPTIIFLFKKKNCIPKQISSFCTPCHCKFFFLILNTSITCDFFLCNDLTQGQTWIQKIYAMFSGKVCQYLESKHVDPVHAGKKKTTLHFSNACILQSVRSKFLKYFKYYLVVVNLKCCQSLDHCRRCTCQYDYIRWNTCLVVEWRSLLIGT